jgi:hypothetical protein
MAEKGTIDALQWARPAHLTRPTVGLDELLRGLALLGTDSDRDTAAHHGWNDPTPASMQVIKSGATAATRWWIKTVGATGGLAGLVTTGTGFVRAVTDTVGTATTVALIAGGAVVLAAVAIALALFVSGDLQARGVATAARHAARGAVAAAFLQASAGLPGQPGDPAPVADPGGPDDAPSARRFRLGDLVVRVERKPG